MKANKILCYQSLQKFDCSISNVDILNKNVFTVFKI